MLSRARTSVVLGFVVTLVAAACGGRSTAPAASPPAATSTDLGTLQSGDLVFLDLDCGDLCNAMASVTEEQFGVSGPALSHVAIIERSATGLSVLEAWPGTGVARTPLAQVLARKQRGPARYLRLRGELRSAGEAATRAAAARIGTPYDEDFLPDNGKLYCSELVQEAYHDAFAANGSGTPSPLHTSPMAFGAPGSAARAVWIHYYGERHIPVPDGVAGISPLGVYLAARSLQATER